MIKTLKKLILALQEHVIPPTCLLCSAGHTGDIALICDPCRADLPFVGKSCRQCGISIEKAANNSASATKQPVICGSCLKHPPPFSQSLVPLNYTMPINKLISEFKYRNKLINGRLLSQLLLQEIQTRYQNQKLPDLLLPVPLHWRRQFRRGYNQSQCVTSYLGTQLCIPVELRRIARTRRTPSQQGLNKQERQRNLKRAFTVKQPFKGETVAIIDDVMTTGATCAEISRELLSAGAAEVHIWALARTPAPSK